MIATLSKNGARNKILEILGQINIPDNGIEKINKKINNPELVAVLEDTESFISIQKIMNGVMGSYISVFYDKKTGYLTTDRVTKAELSSQIRILEFLIGIKDTLKDESQNLEIKITPKYQEQIFGDKSFVDKATHIVFGDSVEKIILDSEKRVLKISIKKAGFSQERMAV